ncbi:MAG: class I SAM-dependent methyltransferase [Oscillochloridaceae bacterium umkhey_bin13]
MNVPETKQLFDAHYYATGCGMPYVRNEAWLTFFDGIAAQIVRTIGPATVLDAGCALGLLVERLRAHDVAAAGVDISEYAISQAHPEVQPFVRVGSVTEPLAQRYDLIVCIEVLEHMQVREAEQAVAVFCAASDDVLFSSSPHDYKEATHFNVNPPEYWAELFARHGFVRDLDFDATFITPWAARFRRRSDPLARIIRDYERRHWLLLRESHDLRQLALEQRAELAAAHLANEHAAQADTLAAALTASQAYAQELEATLATKNAHIARLEALLARIEHGRLMRLLRLLGGRRG